MCRPAFFGEPGRGPRVPVETSFEVSTADEEQPRIDPCAVESPTVELSDSTGTGPLVGEYDHADSHA